MSHPLGSPCLKVSTPLPAREPGGASTQDAVHVASCRARGAGQHPAVFPRPPTPGSCSPASSQSSVRAPAGPPCPCPALWVLGTLPMPLFSSQNEIGVVLGGPAAQPVAPEFWKPCLGVPAGTSVRLSPPAPAPTPPTAASGRTRAHLEVPASPRGQAALRRVGDVRPTQVLQPARGEGLTRAREAHVRVGALRRALPGAAGSGTEGE